MAISSPKSGEFPVFSRGTGKPQCGDRFADDCLHRQYFVFFKSLIGAITFGRFSHKALHRPDCKPVANPALLEMFYDSILTMVVPNFTSIPGPAFSTSQLAFAAVISLVLYGSFVFVQTMRHRDYFLPVESGDVEHAPPPSASVALTSLGLLLVSLVAVVGLAKALTPLVENLIESLGAPKAVVGIAIAMLVLMPEGLAALRAARANRLQTSLNLALGSALASIGLTIPAVAVVSIVLGRQLDLGLQAKESVLLALTLLVGVITLGTGRTTVLQGIVHLVIFAAFLFLTVVP